VIVAVTVGQEIFSQKHPSKNKLGFGQLLPPTWKQVLLMCCVKQGKCLYFVPWASEGFFPSRANGVFFQAPKRFSQGGQEWYNFILPTLN